MVQKETPSHISYRNIQVQFGIEDPSFAGVHVSCLSLPLGLRLCGVGGHKSRPSFPQLLLRCKRLEVFVGGSHGNVGGCNIGLRGRCHGALCVFQDAYGVGVQCIELWGIVSGVRYSNNDMSHPLEFAIANSDVPPMQGHLAEQQCTWAQSVIQGPAGDDLIFLVHDIVLDQLVLVEVEKLWSVVGEQSCVVVSANFKRTYRSRGIQCRFS